MRPEPGTRRPRFTREQIATTALAIADAEGLDAVSMRRVAADLGAGTMTLYHYVSTKDELLSLMDDAMMGEIVLPDEQLPRDDWRTALTAIARSSRGAFDRHPWALQGLRGTRFGPNAMRHFEQSLAAVEATGLPPSERLALVAIVDDFVFGFVMRQAGDTPERTTDDGGWDERAAFDYLDRMVAAGDFPALGRLLGNGGGDRAAAWQDVSAGWGDRFEHGLSLLLDGIELHVRSSRI